MPVNPSSKQIVINLDAAPDVRTVLNYIVGQMVARSYSEREIWQVWDACRRAEDVDELCGWVNTFCQSGSHKLRNAKTVARELGAVGTNTPLAPIFQKVFIFCHAWFG